MEMIVWGGDVQGLGITRTGGRYNPTTDTWTQTNINGSPSARILSEAIWTGSEMIVWGGSTGQRTAKHGRALQSGDRRLDGNFDADAPTARVFHTIIWTGSQMIVWGGSNLTATNNFNTGGRYNPANDTWTATSTINAPTGRNSHTAIWTGTEMMIWGGMANANLFNTGGRYNPVTDTWTPTKPQMRPARAGCTRRFGRERNDDLGRFVNNAFPFESTNTGGRYNPATDIWRPTTLLRSAGQKQRAHGGLDRLANDNLGRRARPESIYANTGGIYNVETVQQRRALYDFDGDGKADVSVFRGGTWHLLTI